MESVDRLAESTDRSPSRAVLDTPDDVHRMLIAAHWEPREGGWRDPADGDVVRWGEALRRARRRVK